MTDLTDFLLARFAEDQAVARAARGARVESGEIAKAHVKRWQPARVLAECDAKRRIVEDIGIHGAEPLDYGGFTLNRVLRLLALPYSAHPEYREEWSP